MNTYLITAFLTIFGFRFVHEIRVSESRVNDTMAKLAKELEAFAGDAGYNLDISYHALGPYDHVAVSRIYSINGEKITGKIEAIKHVRKLHPSMSLLECSQFIESLM